MLPDETIPSASFDFTMLKPITKLEFFFLLMEIEESLPRLSLRPPELCSVSSGRFCSAFSMIGFIFSLSPISATERCGCSRQQVSRRGTAPAGHGPLPLHQVLSAYLFPHLCQFFRIFCNYHESSDKNFPVSNTGMYTDNVFVTLMGPHF